MFLHAASMQFALKDGKQDYVLHAPLPQELSSVVDALETGRG
jgi:23S rRNA pseudouridine955/2504/2580 synthase